MKRKKVRKGKTVRAAKSTPKKARGKKAAATKRPNKTPRLDAVDAMIAANAETLGLTLDPAWQAGIKFNMQLVLCHAALVEEFPLPDDAEPAPVFHA
jgi:Protein of unknown function (DUF4089)